MSAELIEKSDEIEENEHLDLEGLVGYNLKRAYVVVQDDFRRTLADEDLSARLFAALSLIVQLPGLTQTALAKRLGIERSGLVAMVDDLVGREYISRETVPGDRRVHALMPKQKGVKAYRRALLKIEAHENTLLGHFSKSEKKTLLGLLKKVRLKDPEL